MAGGSNNSQESSRTPLGPVSANELIDDRALESADGDRFRLTDFVQELAQRCRVIPTPANIALYGAWGSGKTSLGNLLQATFKNDPDVAFGRFDAFKFAEVPLRRHFLASVATWFEIRKPIYSDDLYKETKEQHFRITKRDVAELLLAMGAAAACLTLVIALAGLVIAGLSSAAGSFGKTYVATLRASAPGIVIAVPIVGAILAMAFDRFEIETTRTAPFSDEEFEKRFKLLVQDIKAKTKRKRVLIFIDELDRCSPKQVGSVLETLRTFLDVESCVFIVAADQQVLEHALMEGGARQATPSDAANPYYSSGSAYLDKIFHQQIPLPPLLPRTLSQFALTLVQGCGGVWKRVPNQPELISVLVPNHVRSPRRVKTLLNTFSSLYRLAILRAEAGALDEDVELRASEIGKLVCLRTEFPLFARDLSTDARLPEIVLALNRKPSTARNDLGLAGLTPEVFERASAYASGRLPVAELLAQDSRAERESLPAESAAVEEDDPEADEVLEASGESGASSSPQRAYAEQLISYLYRTESIPGPRRDLIYLEGSGLAFHLPAEFADRIENDARNGQTQEVAAQVRELSPDDQLAACRLLAQLVIEGTVGLETTNAVRSLLAATKVVSSSIEPIADELLNALANYASGYVLDPADLEGALRLSLASESRSAISTRESVMARPEVISDADLGLVVLDGGDLLLASFQERLGEVLVARLGDTAIEEVLASLSDLTAASATAIIAAIPQPEDDDEESTLHNDLRELIETADSSDRIDITSAAFDRLLALDTTEARTEAAKVIDRVAPILDVERCRAVLSAARRRSLSAWPSWLEHVEDGSLKASDPTDNEALGVALKRIWTERFSPTGTQTSPPTAEDALAATKALAAVADDLPLTDFDCSNLLATTKPSPVTTEAEGAAREEQHATLRSFQEERFVGDAVVGDAIVADLNETLGAAVTALQAEEVGEWIAAAVQKTIASASLASIDSFVESLTAAAWLDDDARKSIRLLAAAARHEQDASTVSPLAGAEVAELLESGAPAADEAVSRWIEAFQPGGVELLAAVGSRASTEGLSVRMRAALGELSESWSAEEKGVLFEAVAPGFVSGTGSAAILRDARMGGAEPDRVVETLIRLAKDAGNNSERDRVLQLWEIVQPASQKARQALVDGIYLPLIDGGKGQVKLALDHFGLVASSVGKPTQSKIKKALERAAATAGDKDLQKRVNRVLKEVGWIKRLFKWK